MSTEDATLGGGVTTFAVMITAEKRSGPGKSGLSTSRGGLASLRIKSGGLVILAKVVLLLNEGAHVVGSHPLPGVKTLAESGISGGKRHRESEGKEVLVCVREGLPLEERKFDFGHGCLGVFIVAEASEPNGRE